MASAPTPAPTWAFILLMNDPNSCALGQNQDGLFISCAVSEKRHVPVGELQDKEASGGRHSVQL